MMNEPAMQIKASTAADAAAIQAVARAAWDATYRDLIPAEARAEYLRRAYDPGWLAQLHARDNVRGFIVWRGAQAVGFAMLSLGSPEEDPPGAVLRSLYLLPEAQKLGYGRKLLEAAREAARASGAPFLWVAVHSGLSAARRWYEQQGFIYDGPADTQIGGANVNQAVYRMPLGRD